MKKRMLMMLVMVTVFLVAIGTVKVRQIQAAIAKGMSYQPPPEAVTTLVVTQEQWPETLREVGTVVAVHGVMVSADQPGIVAAINFDSGQAVKAGQVLVRLDTREEEAQLAAAEAQDSLAHVNLTRMRGLLDQGVVAQSDYDQAVAENRQTDAKISELHATIDRKQIRAPFDGVLGIRQVNLGQYLKSGDSVVPLQSLNPIYVDFAVPQQEFGHLRVGREVRVTAENATAGEEELTGKVSALDSVVDQATRNVQVRATLANPKERLRPGMFVRAEVLLGKTNAVIALPATSIAYAPYGDSVFVVSQLEGKNGQSYKGVRQQFVKVGDQRGDQIAVLSGLEPGAEVVTSGAFKLRNGAAILVNNSVRPSNSLNPHPENN